MSSASAVQLEPITGTDVQSVAEFLHAHLNSRVPAANWCAAMTPAWSDGPNHGFHLRADGAVVGAYLALYSHRTIDGRTEQFCNLAAWCVLEQYRFSSVRLLKALLAQPGYHFTDFSPSGNVVALNLRLGFVALDTATDLVVNLPWPTRPGRGRVTSNRAAIERTLVGEDLAVFLDHADAPGVKHLLVSNSAGHCHVMFRRDRRKKLPLFASLVHVSNVTVLRQEWRRVARRLLTRRGLPFTLAERRITDFRPVPSVKLGSPRPKMYRSDRLRADQIDYLYSELVAVAW
jgi:hypothetical protein